ncbi:MAG: hypothetical protein M8353_10490 [ANME-2 cluster archaeon]|nr:hypothetical protein [ANME-2 cluster archaeon]
MSSSRKEAMKNMHRLLKDIDSILTELVSKLPPSGECACSHALRGLSSLQERVYLTKPLRGSSAIPGKYHLDERSGHPHGTVMK